MTREDIEQIPEMVKSGKTNWEQVAKELVVFIVKNKPMFSLQKFDEDFISDFIITFLDKGPESMNEYDTSRGSFFAYLFCITRNFQTSLMKKAAIHNQIEYLKMNESICNYENKIEAYKNIKYDDFERPKVPFSYKPISYKDFQIACKTDTYHIKKVMNSDTTVFSENIKEPFAVIHAGELTPEIAELAREISQFGNGKGVIIGYLFPERGYGCSCSRV